MDSIADAAERTAPMPGMLVAFMASLGLGVVDEGLRLRPVRRLVEILIRDG